MMPRFRTRSGPPRPIATDDYGYIHPGNVPGNYDDDQVERLRVQHHDQDSEARYWDAVEHEIVRVFGGVQDFEAPRIECADGQDVAF